MLNAVVSLILAASSSNLDRGCSALAEYRVEEAIELLEKAKNEGPFLYQDYVRLFEKLGIAYAYLGGKKQASEAFEMLLALDPGHALDYTLSPKVTFLFEQARKPGIAQLSPTVDLSWPRDLKVTDKIPIEVEVVSDPKGFLSRAVLHSKRKGADTYTSTPLVLTGPGHFSRIELPPVAPGALKSEMLQIYLTVTDERGNEVLLVGTPKYPREILLSFVEPEPWYRKWWIWAAASAVVAGGTGAAVYLLLHEPPNTVGGTFRVP